MNTRVALWVCALLLVVPTSARAEPPLVVSPLGEAIGKRSTDEVRRLLASGVDPNEAAFNDEPPLLIAAMTGRFEIVKLLIERGAAIDHISAAVGSVLSAAVLGKDQATFDLLLARGAPLDTRSEGGAHPLHYAALTGQLAMVKRLLAAGANLHCPNFQGGTALRSAADGGNADVVRALLEAGADPATRDQRGKRPIDYARENRHAAVVAILENAKSRQVSSRGCVARTPMHQVLPTREDAGLRQMIEAHENGWEAVGPVVSNAIVAPSLIASAVVFDGPDFKVTYPVPIAAPDPRLPVRPVAVTLWTYQQGAALTTVARPVLPPPSSAITQTVAALAMRPYGLSRWSARAAQIARRLDPAQRNELLGVMVHVPMGPTYLMPWDWRFRVQVAVALMVSYLPGGRQALEDVIDGPVDWTNTAAIIGLLDLGRRDEKQRSSVIRTLTAATRRPMSPPAFQDVIRPAALALLELEGVQPAVLRSLEKLVEDSRD